MKQLKHYFKLQKEIYEYFGYQEDWCVIPLDDLTDQYWILSQKDDGSGFVIFSSDPITQEVLDSGLYYCNAIFMQEHLPKWVYRAEQHTMICIETQQDGNEFLSVFCNDKEIKTEGLNIKTWLS